MTSVAPGSVIGILGGGQLGRMLANAAQRLGFDVDIYCPEDDPPAARVARHHWKGAYDNKALLAEFAKACAVITLEFENIPVIAADVIEATGHHLYPGAKSLAVSQDRAEEKAFLNDIGIATADYRVINSDQDIAKALPELGGTGLLKTRRDGYDGKGQARLETGDDLAAALPLGQRQRLGSEYAQRAQHGAVGEHEGSPGVEPDMGRAHDHRVIGEPGIDARVVHLDHRGVAGLDAFAERQLARRLGQVEAVARLEPLPVGVDEAHRRRGRSAQIRG